MSQPKKWFLGLVPVAGLLLAAGLMRQGGVETDLTAKGAAQLAASGFPWAKVSMAGRDAILTGEAPEPELRGMAVAAADRVLGIRIVNDKMTVLPEAKPYALNATIEGTKLTLAGSVPSAAVRAQVLDAAKKAFPSAQVDDQLKLARGAPTSYLAGAGFGLGELGKLSSGQMTLTDQSLSITGRAADIAKFVDVRAKLANLPQGITLGKGLGEGDILAPIVKPYTIAAEKTDAATVLTGHVPNEATRRIILAAATALGKPVTDRLQIADGAAPAFSASVDYGLGQLGRLQTGQMSLSDQTLSVTGRAASGEAYDDVRRRFASLPAGVTLAKGLGQGDITSPAIRPYLFNAVRGERDVTLTGFAPDARTKAEIVDHAKRFFEGDRIVDQLQVGQGAPAGFVNAVRGGLQDLSRLLPGGTLSLSDASIALRGLAPLDTARDQAVAAFRARVPQGYGSAVEVNTAPPPPVITVFSECNILFQDLLSRAQINFDTGSSTIVQESYGLLDRLVVVVRRCADAKVEISGHTDSVGSLESNMTLSEARAKSVVEYLARSGIAGDRVEARGFGPTQPRASNDTAEGRAQNRRIEFKVQ
ncbi:MAG: OmpA family protein [Rhizobiales bacterium]|nr:OmpA family protein [Hyphomicrobiales bacterium]